MVSSSGLGLDQRSGPSSPSELRHETIQRGLREFHWAETAIHRRAAPAIKLERRRGGVLSITRALARASDIMTRHGRAVQATDLQGEPVRIGLLSDFPGISAYLYRVLSIAFVIAVMFWTVSAVRRRRSRFLTRAGIVIVMWTASIATAAGAHTLDVLAIPDSRSADGGPHAVPFHRRTGRNGRMPRLSNLRSPPIRSKMTRRPRALVPGGGPARHRGNSSSRPLAKS
ncbi:hypothetical protein V1278_003376 [Bradyrhizobium sp. AZCC 1577]